MPAQYALRRIEFCDLPTLKRWRSLPEVQRHLRHPKLSWLSHLLWWWGIRRHTHPTQRVWAVVNAREELVGQVGYYYRSGDVAEASVLACTFHEDYALERELIPLLDAAARADGVRYLYAEVLTRAPLKRHGVFVGWGVTHADTKSTIYKRVIA